MSAGWPSRTLGELFRIKHGFAFKGEYFADKGDFVLLTPGNFEPTGGLKLKGKKEKYYSGDFPVDFLLHHGDLLVVMTDLTQDAGILGSPAVIPESGRFLHNQRLGKVVGINEDLIDRRFLYHLFNGRQVREQIKASATGSTVRHTAPERIYAVTVRLPDLQIQRRIASILSAYDGLIENNTRRIAILEEMARRIYEEWFVRFRFPGHEGVRMVESELGLVPDEWDLTNLKTVCVSKDGIQTGPFGSQLHKADYSNEGVPVLMPKDLIGFRIRTDTIARISEATADRLARHRVKPGDIVYGRRGDIGRRAYVMAHQAGWFCGTGCLRIRPDPEKISGWYLFNFIGQESVVGLIAGRAHGVTMPNLNARLMESVPVVSPPRELQNQFEQATFSMFVLREKLIAKNQNLRTTRDFLLPKLISGELDVSAMPAPESIAA
jgi:type I restriction enzyme, S subunit